MESVVLVEVLVTNADDRFRFYDFTQELDGRPRSSWQAAWQEATLSADGRRLLQEPLDRLQRSSFRAAFFLHYYQPDKVLLSSYGKSNCPPGATMPARLIKLVPFIPVD